jgi:hypothetical protein
MIMQTYKYDIEITQYARKNMQIVIMYANQVKLNANYTIMICNMQHIYNEMQDANAYPRLPTLFYVSNK